MSIKHIFGKVMEAVFMENNLASAESFSFSAELEQQTNGSSPDFASNGVANAAGEAVHSGSNNGTILTSTLWEQEFNIYVKINGVQTELEEIYNKYCPNASSSDTTKTVTGCTNTADSQIIYYWIEKGYSFSLTVSTSDYFYLQTGTTTSSSAVNAADGGFAAGFEDDPAYTKYYVAEKANIGEGTLSELNSALSSSSRIANGDFIAALNFYCGVKNHSGYSKDGTSTYYKYGAYTDGTNAAAYKAAGFDSFYSITRAGTAAASKVFFDKDGLSDVGYSIIRENLDYGEPIRVGIPEHDIYLDGYRSTSGGYEYHLNYGWGTNASKYTTWYSEEDLTCSTNTGSLVPPLYIDSIIIDISPDINAKVTSDRGDYYGGSFLRGVERINHVVKSKSAKFTFDDSVAGSIIAMSESAAITSSVDLTFPKVNAAVSTSAKNLISSARGLDFNLDTGSLSVIASSPGSVIAETGNSAVTVSMTDSYIFSGSYSAGAEDLDSLLRRSAGHSYGEFGDSFYTSVSGYGIKAGSASDSVTLSNGSAIYGGLDLGGGSNVLTIENGSLFCGSFTGSANTLTANLNVTSTAYNGPMIVVKDSSSASSFYNAVGGVLNVTVSQKAAAVPQLYNLVSGISSGVMKNFSVNFTAPGISRTLTYDDPEYGNYSLVFDNDQLGLLFRPGTVKKDKVNLYYGDYLINSGSALENISVNSGLLLDVLGGGTASSVSVAAAGTVAVYDDGSVDTVSVGAGGSAILYSGSSGSKIDVAGTLTVKAGAVAGDTAVSAGGKVAVEADGVLDKSLSIAAGGEVSFAKGGTLVIDISGKDPASSGILVNNIGLISGSPTILLKMDQAQALGKYTIASGADGFSCAVSVMADDQLVGSMTMNTAMRSSGFYCSLEQASNGDLDLVVDHADDSVKIQHDGSVGNAGNYTETLLLSPDYAGRYNLYGNFGVLNGSITVYNGKKAIGSGTIKNGSLTNFNKGKTILLDSAVQYTVVVKNSDKGKSASDFNYWLQGVSIFWNGSHDDDTPDARPAITVVARGTKLASGWVGFSDVNDYQKFTLKNAADLSLTVSASESVKVTIFDRNMKSLQSIMVKANGLAVSADTKNKLFEAGTYYLQVQSQTAAKGGGADYSVTVNAQTTFFSKGDNSDDSPNRDLPLTTVTAPVKLVTNGWVGCGDTTDYIRIRLDTAASLSFTISANDSVKFLVIDATSGKTLQTSSLKASNGVNASTETKSLLMDSGEYYLAVTVNNAKKGNADYNLSVNSSSRFFTKADHTNDTVSQAAQKAAVLPGEDITGWVGFGDAVDYIKLGLEQGGKLRLNLDGKTAADLAARKIKIFCEDEYGNAVALAQNDQASLFSNKAVSAGTYFLGVQCSNVKKYDTDYKFKAALLA